MIRWKKIEQRIRRVFRGKRGITVVEDNSTTSDYTFEMTVHGDVSIVISDIKEVIINNPWSTTATMPEVVVLEQKENAKTLNVSFGVINANKGKIVEQEVRELFKAIPDLPAEKNLS